jgi:hypothetical protein
MKFSQYLKILALVVCATLPTQIFAQRIVLSGEEVKSESDIERIRYEFYRTFLSRVNYGSLASRLNISKIDKKILFVSEDLEFFKNRYVPIYKTLFKEPEKFLLIRAYDVKIDTEISWLYFEKTGFLTRIDLVDRASLTEDFSRNYDYIITMKSPSSDLRDAKSVSNRKTEYFVQHVKTGSESKIAETIGSPILLTQLDNVAINLSNFVSASSVRTP